MKKAIAVLGVAGTLALAAAPPAHAGSSTDAALALGAFAVFNQFVTGQTVFQRAYPPQPVYVQPAPPVYYAPPPPTVIYTAIWPPRGRPTRAGLYAGPRNAPKPLEGSSSW